jgi:hypothetical protein
MRRFAMTLCASHPRIVEMKVPMNSAPSHKNVAESLEIMAKYVSTSPELSPAQFVVDLGRYWKKGGGRVAGKYRHSDRYLDELLRRNGNPIRSLTPKLLGKTHLKPRDAEVLVRTFLSHWTYNGDPHSGEISSDRSVDLYTPLLPDAEIDGVSAYVAGQIASLGAEVRGAVEPAPATPSLPGQDTSDLIAAEFQEAAALFVAGAGQTMLVPQPETVLIGFRNLMDRLWDFEKADRQQRMLIWLLDLGRRRFEDLESRKRFINVQDVITRFKALKQFKEDLTDKRLNWLQSRVMIVLHDTSSDRPAANPSFDSHHVVFSAVPPRWVGSPEFSTLYPSGRVLEEGNYTIFLKRAPEHASECRGADEISRQGYVLKYFGHAILGKEGKRQSRSLELGWPGESYTEALGTVFVAAANLLGLQGKPAEVSIDKMKITRARAIEKLRHLGFLLLRLDEFMKF